MSVKRGSNEGPLSTEICNHPKSKGDGLMIGRIIGGVLLGAIIGALVYEIIERENPELIQKAKDWFSKEDDFIEPEEVPAE